MIVLSRTKRDATRVVPERRASGDGACPPPPSPRLRRRSRWIRRRRDTDEAADHPPFAVRPLSLCSITLATRQISNESDW